MIQALITAGYEQESIRELLVVRRRRMRAIQMCRIIELGEPKDVIKATAVPMPMALLLLMLVTAACLVPQLGRNGERQKDKLRNRSLHADECTAGMAGEPQPE